MLRLLCLLLVFTCCSGGIPLLKHRLGIHGRMSGGEDAKIDEFPYQVGLEHNEVHICGGSIINKIWIVTSAFCVDGLSLNLVRLRAGSNYKRRGGALHDAAQIILHPDYNSDTRDADIAVVRVAKPFTYGARVKNVTLTATEPAAGHTSVVSGWGDTAPFHLQKAVVPIVDRDKCADDYANYGGIITQNMICAGVDSGGKDPCQDDSGGPLVVAGELVGVISWGIGCIIPGLPSVYSNIASLRDFISQHTGVN